MKRSSGSTVVRLLASTHVTSGAGRGAYQAAAVVEGFPLLPLEAGSLFLRGSLGQQLGSTRGFDGPRYVAFRVLHQVLLPGFVVVYGYGRIPSLERLLRLFLLLAGELNAARPPDRALAERGLRGGARPRHAPDGGAGVSLDRGRRREQCDERHGEK